ncbi:MAG: hypothetical protein Q9184_000466 [Pyrenodesmia sp. 2 TL-2023]
MSSNTGQGFLDAIAVPFQSFTRGPGKSDRKRALKRKRSDVLKEMVESIECFHRTEGQAREPTEKATVGNSVRNSPDGRAMCVEHTEPVTLRERLVFRTDVPIPKRALQKVHKSFQDKEALINDILVNKVETGKKLTEIHVKEAEDFSEADYILLRCYLRERHQAKLMTKAKLNGVIVPEIRGLQLLEQFWRRQGAPNEAEAILLGQVTQHTPIHIRSWFATVKKASKVKRAMRRKILVTLGITGHDVAVRRTKKFIRAIEEKPSLLQGSISQIRAYMKYIGLRDRQQRRKCLM